GFAFKEGGGLCGVDLDRCRDAHTGGLAKWALVVLRMLNSYAEVSPSGAGVKVVVRGSLPFPDGQTGTRRPIDRLVQKLGLDPSTCGPGAIEGYNCLRYFTLTGHRLDSYPATINAPDPSALRKLYKAAFHVEPKATPRQVAPPRVPLRG